MSAKNIAIVNREAYLRQHYSQMGASWCGARLQISANATRLLAKRLGLVYRETLDWSAWDAWLRSNYPQRGAGWCAGELGISVSAVRSRASLLELRIARDGQGYREWRENLGAAMTVRAQRLRGELPVLDEEERPSHGEIHEALFALGVSESYGDE